MMKKMTLTKADLDIINMVVSENNIVGAFDLLYEDGSGIGYCVDMEFPLDVNGREATIRVPITGVENW